MKENNTPAVILAVSSSAAKGVKKRNVNRALLVEGRGVEGDAHAGGGIRQVSLLAIESIKKMKGKGLALSPGDFAENITTQGIDLKKLSIGTRLKIGNDAVIEISQHGKECHNRCSIYYTAGDCIMPKEGVFARVVRGGCIKPGDMMEVLDV